MSREGRTLAILSENAAGAVAVLNLLMMAGLDHFFAAIWTPACDAGVSAGVYREGGTWRKFEAARDKLESKSARAVLVHRITSEPEAWFPQLESGAEPNLAHLANLKPEDIIAVDDERTNFVLSEDDGEGVPRYCRVARYDDEFRDQGFTMHLGGIGAKSERDYEILSLFIEKPWRFRVADPTMTPRKRLEMSCTMSCTSLLDDSAALPPLVRCPTEENCNRDKTEAARRRITSNADLLARSEGESPGGVSCS
eukprot:TRINITY_DN27142_c0_g1_i2.p1 TRINITY_DN27142_c0_g1~~TRINITY_DN27142_c0_g1_i2.p1  ORF type:complete len:253 (+),score=35.40 TRINITY_DN27142_c0_g1_i2:753-1511(+)